MAVEAVFFTFHSSNEEDTERLADKLVQWFESGTVILLDGDLGAGKTRFSQAVAKSLGVAEVVSSPTFTLIKEYQGAVWRFYHMDMYRLKLEEAEELGLEEYFYGEGITIIEWASRITELLPVNRLQISIENLGGTERLFGIKPNGHPYTEWCRRLQRMGELT